VQVLPTHAAPPEQTLPHFPQFSGSDVRSTQPPLQAVPWAQLVAHVPWLHTFPVGQVNPH
jgi:hypothetical protein